MPYSKTCKLVALGTIGVLAILVLVTLYSLRPSRLCPNEGELMHRETSTCYPKETKGPCPNNLVLLGESGRSQHGECSCPYNLFNRTLLYDKATEECYFVFTQAFCPSGQWLSLRRDGTPFCEENYCLHHAANVTSGDPDADVSLKPAASSSFQYENVQWVPVHGGGCARLGFEEEGCPAGGVVRFHKDYIIPSCHTPPKRLNTNIGSIGVPASNCRLGSYPSIMGKCQPQFEFDFD
ncbi:uncharacterized protein LOC110852977 isoform X2 [Folsomia candida]|uniref:uncharacterized protein LOC110852977 isoform X2 n=1 Tax=Folsomia candida TaxID=158441 RepID=UPI00160546DA|nr:uncharacterized protein LOC110852977 isoform X2 [Folsomia candida]